MALDYLRSFRQKVRHRRSAYRRFLSRLKRENPRGLDKITESINQDIWAETNCLSCANCCRTMTPTYTAGDIRRIAAHTGLSQNEFKKKWLVKEKGTGDWLNRSTPCQFLDLTTNKCNIYEVRPADCAGFPHLTKKRMVDYIHVHHQNIELCPATLNMVARMVKLMGPQ